MTTGHGSDEHVASLSSLRLLQVLDCSPSQTVSLWLFGLERQTFREITYFCVSVL